VALAMLVPGASTAPAVKVGGITSDDVQAPAGMEAIGKAVAACGEDEACRARTMMAIGQRLKGNPDALGTLKQDDTRYENWIPDRRGVCATGSITVEDTKATASTSRLRPLQRPIASGAAAGLLCLSRQKRWSKSFAVPSSPLIGERVY
jgi:hypothetical protein